jgi:hypothetical protein
MPLTNMAAASTGDAWRSRRVAFVQSPASDHGCRCQVRLMHSSDQASISLQLQHAPNLVGVTNHPPRHVVLHIQPSIVKSCSIAEETSISPLLLNCIPTSITSASDVLTVAIVLKSSGAVHYPKGLTSVRPTDPDDVDFQSFIEICQATTIYIHFARTQFDQQEKTKLEEGTWQVFSSKASGFSHEATSSSLGKRSRQGKHLLAIPPTSCRCASTISIQQAFATETGTLGAC